MGWMASRQSPNFQLAKIWTWGSTPAIWGLGENLRTWTVVRWQSCPFFMCHGAYAAVTLRVYLYHHDGIGIGKVMVMSSSIDDTLCTSHSHDALIFQAASLSVTGSIYCFPSAFRWSNFGSLRLEASCNLLRLRWPESPNELSVLSRPYGGFHKWGIPQ